jgi:hypothetical protein
MKQKEAKVLIIQEWDRWVQAQSFEPSGSTGRESLKFFFELQDANSTFLNFHYNGRDKWQVVTLGCLAHSASRVAATRNTARWIITADLEPHIGFVLTKCYPTGCNLRSIPATSMAGRRESQLGSFLQNESLADIANLPTSSRGSVSSLRSR